MKRVVLLALAACAPAPSPPPIARVTPPPPPPAEQCFEAPPSELAVPGAVVAPELHGRLAFVVRSEPDGEQVYSARLGDRGVFDVRRVTRGRTGGIKSLSFTRDGERIVYLRDDDTGSLVTVARSDGTEERPIARCRSCDHAAVGPDEHVWFVAATEAGFDTVMRAPLAGGIAATWEGEPVTWGACRVEIEGRAGTLLLTVAARDPQWPECAASGLIGHYLIDAPARGLPRKLGEPPALPWRITREEETIVGEGPSWRAELVRGGKLADFASWQGEVTCQRAPSGDLKTAPAFEEPRIRARKSPLKGTLVLAYDDAVHVAELSDAGITEPRKILSGGARVVGAVHGNEAIVVDHSDSPVAIHAIDLQDGKDRLVVKCDHTCEVAGVAKDGTLWFVDRNTPKIATVKSIPLKGGTARKWGGDVPGWWACYAQATLEREQLVVGVNNALGWPDCQERRQGIYIVPLQGKPGAPIQPKGHPQATPVGAARLDATGERVVFQSAGTAFGPATFSCKKDGTDVRVEPVSPDAEWMLVVRDRTLVALPPRGSTSPPVPILGPIAAEATFALRR